MFLIGHQRLSASEVLQDIISRHSHCIEQHILQSHPSGFSGRAQYVEIESSFTPVLPFGQLTYQRFKLPVSVVLSCKSKHIIAVYLHKSDALHKKIQLFVTKSPDYTSSFSLFYSNFFFLIKFYLRFVVFSCLTRYPTRDNFAPSSQ